MLDKMGISNVQYYTRFYVYPDISKQSKKKTMISA